MRTDGGERKETVAERERRRSSPLHITEGDSATCSLVSSPLWPKGGICARAN
jgi:hypothetical protein